ncbi:TetR/AcrR family transcriptional regulator [Kordiimonas aquimaris]|uniref:TetR/AcrR family transcriptional regulator n=1 Tax=Kordiimonas aquimaris TaxID=707591 RepID=UPI0021D3BF34|nr:TetR/AcrR family transcriptional regulator [Kordiimonas aquimaris]
MTSTTYAPKAIEILDVAEMHMRRGGFDAISFRDIATQVGIKSASVHYHFPQKADLGEAVVNRYRDKILNYLGEPTSYTMVEAIEKLITLYETALTGSDSVCLCCVLGSEADTLPDKVAHEVNVYFTDLSAWARTALNPKGMTKDIDALATFTISVLQGAMTMSVAMNDNTQFTAAANLLKGQIQTEEFRQSLFKG